MNAILFGGDNTALNTTTTQFNFLSACFSSSWNATESARTIPISEAITITKFTVYADTAPGLAASGKQFTFTIRDNGADTAASLVILETALTNVFTGSVAISKDHLVCIEVIPLNTPSASTNVFWVIEYTTAGQSFIIMGSNTNTASNSAAAYSNIAGGIGTAMSATDGDFDIVIPSAGTLTALSVASPAGNMGGAGKQYAVSVNRNNGTLDLTATMVNTDVAAQATGSVAWTAGDLLSIKSVPGSTPTARRLAWCISVTPTTNGEVFSGFGSAAAPSASANNFEQLQGNGNNGWNSSEAVRISKPPTTTFKKLYVKIATDPGGVTSRTITLMDNGVATALAATVVAGGTVGNDTTHSVSESGGGNTGSWRSSVSGSPAASAGVHIGFVMAVTQPAGGSSIKSWIGLAKASIKTVNGLAIASVKTINGLA